VKSFLLAALTLGLLVGCKPSQDAQNPQNTPTPTNKQSTSSAPDKPDLTDPRQKTSYALGMNIATRLKRDGVDLDMTALAAGMNDMQAGNPALTHDQQAATMKDMQKDIKARAQEKRKIAGAKNLKDGQAFLAANAQKDGVRVLKVTAPDGSQAEEQYLVLKSGTGPSPGKTDVLKLNYECSLIDGTVFDSSVQRGIPWTGRANDFIAGWTEPLQMMKVGDKWRLFIPPSLGYGEYVPYNIGPNSTLIYDIELLEIQKPPATDSMSSTNAPAAPGN
jgi:FKBP-type peptidyl-prolyl cis-trans isomerase FklB